LGLSHLLLKTRLLRLCLRPAESALRNLFQRLPRNLLMSFPRKVHLYGGVLFIVLCSLHLTFVPAVTDFQLVGISTDAGTKESEHEGVHVAKSPSSLETPTDIETATPHDTSVLDIVLVSGHAGTVNCDAACG
jgi:hypothetical protein